MPYVSSSRFRRKDKLSPHRQKWQIVAMVGSVLIGLLALLLGLGYGIAQTYLKASCPKTSGAISVPSIGAPVEIFRDALGVPHIYARSDEDAHFALGFAMAQDRLFQMELIRRTVRGRLAELLGRAWLPTDRLFRLLTATRPVDGLAAKLPTQVRAALEAFARGVNSYLQKHTEALPIEFFVLGYTPEPWTVEDSMTPYYLWAWGGSATFHLDLVYATIAERVGEDLAREIWIDYPEGYPVLMPETGARDPGAGDARLSLLRLEQEVRQRLGFDGMAGSNAWVVAPSKSSTGGAILANDIHLGHGIPGFWYGAHLVSPNQNVMGIVLPGLPFVVAGANEQVAWGLTSAMADEMDYYLEKQDPDNPRQIEYHDTFEEVSGREETLRIRHELPVPFQVRWTRHGPVISDLLDLRERKEGMVTMRWTAFEFPQSIEAFLLANRARDIDELESSLQLYKTPAQSWVYADTKGNIGTWTAGAIPIRNGFNGKTLLPGWDGRHEWNGFVPAADLPHLQNPAEGFIATANNKIAGAEFAHVISNAYAPPDRILRIREMLQKKKVFEPQDLMDMQLDDTMVLAREWIPLLAKILQERTLKDLERQALEIIGKWNLRCALQEAGPSIFHVFVEQVAKNTFRPRMGHELFSYYAEGKNSHVALNALRKLVRAGTSTWFDHPATEKVEGLADLFVVSFVGAVAALQEEFGGEPEDWKWGELHRLTFYHALGRQSGLLGRWLNRGPFPMSGGLETVNPAPWSLLPGQPSREINSGASMRMVIDLTPQGKSFWILPTGVSGNPSSPHYDDQIERWLKGEYHPFTLSRAQVEREKESVMTLLPEE